LPRLSVPGPGFGLRPRLLAALALTSVVTLGVASIALLPPLKSRLRSDAISQAKVVTLAAKSHFGSILRVHGLPPRERVAKQARRLGADRVIVWTTRLERPIFDTDGDMPRGFARSVARLALASGLKPRYGIADDKLIVASSYRDHGRKLVLEIFRRLDYVQKATNVVVVAFLEAAAAGLVVALALGAALSSRLVRRLRLLRDATIGLDEGGLGDLVVGQDSARDEIGELARAFSMMRERLRQQEDARRAFVATASHELRTPLTSLDGMLELLADDLESDPIDIDDARERVARAQQQSRRLASLASDLLDLSRIDASVNLRSEPVELVEVVRAVVAEFEGRALDRAIDVVVDGTGSQHWTEGDPAGLARIVRILIDNALRIAPTGTIVTVSLETSGGQSTLEVADSGPGVPADERELIFERFQRGRAHRAEAGFGLGLAIGRELARRMGGSLELLDEGPGARFRLTVASVPVGASHE